jgi:uncharacterized membrane protein
MFWRIWRIIIGALFGAFFVICFTYDCAFIYHTESSGKTLLIVEVVLLLTSLLMVLIDVFEGE